MKLFREKTSIFLIWTGVSILLVFTLLFIYKNEIFAIGKPVDAELLSRYGGFIGGVVGCIWSLSSVILFYVALKDQRTALDLNVKALNTQIDSFQLQIKEFELQRKELEQTREVFEEQSKTLKKQQFEVTFFSMLNLHQDIVRNLSITTQRTRTGNGIEGKITKDIQYNNRKCFRIFYTLYIIDFRKQKDNSSKDLLENIKKSYTLFYKEHQSDLGHYFRNLYNIVKFIERQNPENKFFYSNLLRAQLSSHELLMLFYNCLSSFGREKFKPLVEKYHLLQNMPKSQLIIKEHADLYDKEAFGKPTDNIY